MDEIDEQIDNEIELENNRKRIEKKLKNLSELKKDIWGLLNTGYSTKEIVAVLFLSSRRINQIRKELTKDGLLAPREKKTKPSDLRWFKQQYEVANNFYIVELLKLASF